MTPPPCIAPPRPLTALLGALPLTVLLGALVLIATSSACERRHAPAPDGASSAPKPARDPKRDPARDGAPSDAPDVAQHVDLNGENQHASADAGAPLAEGAAPERGAPQGQAAPGGESAADRAAKDPSVLVAPDRYARVIPRAMWPFKARYGNLCYEGNNINMRGDADAAGLYAASGEEVATRWREFSRGSGCVFVLRDSLFSQQDHPHRQAPTALMMPPNYVTVAVAEVMAGKALESIEAPDPEDDAAWLRLSTPREVFGSFPPSELLFTLSTSPIKGAQSPEAVRNARLSLRSLAADTDALCALAHLGPEAVAQAGAQRISASDARYFTAPLRRDRIVPIFVENPTDKEIEEGKGMGASGLTLPPAALALATRVVYRERLRHGDLAVERYDLSSPAERRRAIALLEALIPPRDAEAGRVWLWVTGPLDKKAKLKGQDATAFIDAFRKEVAAAPVDLDRLRFVSKPQVDLPKGQERSGIFEAALDRFERLDLPLSVLLTTEGLKALIKAPKPR